MTCTTKIIHSHYGTIPPVTFHYDSTAAGLGASGDQEGDPNCPFYIAARTAHHILHQGLQIKVNMSYEKAHAGIFGNECADDIARSAAENVECRLDNWEVFLVQRNQMHLKWLWWTFTHDFYTVLEGTEVKISKPKASFDQSIIDSLTDKDTVLKSTTSEELDLRITSYNAQTLNQGARRNQQGFQASPMKLQAWTRLMREQNIQLFAVQETRLKRHLQENNGYLLFQSLADPRGQGGILIGISKTQSFFKKRDKENETPLAEGDVKIVHSEPEILVVQIEGQGIKMTIAAAHGPHTGYPSTKIKDWWTRFNKILKEAGAGRETILLIDSNARLGDQTSAHVGGYQPEEEHFTSELLKDTLKETGTWIPSTFPHIQCGPGATWQHPCGAESRLDYVCTPLTWRSHSIQTRVAGELTLQEHTHDHRPVYAWINGPHPKEEHSNKVKKKTVPHKIDLRDPTTRDQFQKALPTEGISWKADVHQHTAKITENLMHVAKELGKSRKGNNKRKGHLSEETWQWIEEKRKWRQQFFTTKAAAKFALVRHCFNIWGHSVNAQESVQEKYQDLLRMNAIAEHKMKQASKEVTRRIRYEDDQYFQTFKEAMQEADRKGDTRQLWQEVKRYMPRAAAKRKSIDPKRIKQLEGRWAPHLCSTEAGEEQDIAHLFQDCIDKQNDKIPPPTSLQDLPTLLGVEDSLRQTKAGKAGGPDKLASDWMHYGAKAISLPTWQLATKTRLWATEAFQHKGGSLAWIFKKGSWLLPENYRAIALTSTLGKRIHAPLRKEIMEVLATERTTGQLGGFPGQETLFGTHYLRSFQRTRLMKNDNTAILFIDLRMAFHGLIREAVHGGDNTRAEEQATLWGHLRKEEIPLQTLLREIDQGGCLRQMGANESLIQTLQELSNSTWYEVEGRAVVTMKGSRPGSPLADALFHSQMQRISHKLNEMLKDLTELQEEDGNQKVGAGEPIYWADDLAIPLHATTCSGINQLVEEVTERVNAIFLKYGLKMNFSQGKSGVILTYRGAGSAEARKELLRKREDTFNIHEENKTHKLYKGMTYKHLGVYQESGGQINYEIKCRVGATWECFRALRRSVLCTRRLKLATRLQMCNTLVFTKLFFAAGTLPVLTRKQWKKIDTCYMTILRTITGELYRKDGSRKYKNDEDFLVVYGLTSSRIRITQERLTYARRLSLQAHHLLHEILQQEKESRPDSWHQALEADLRWLQKTSGGNWGLDYQQASEAWRVRKGWSNHIKKAILKHNRQDKIAREIIKWNHNTQHDQRPEAEFECECGQTFRTKGGLATHRARMHNYRTPEYMADEHHQMPGVQYMDTGQSTTAPGIHQQES